MESIEAMLTPEVKSAGPRRDFRTVGKTAAGVSHIKKYSNRKFYDPDRFSKGKKWSGYVNMPAIVEKIKANPDVRVYDVAQDGKVIDVTRNVLASWLYRHVLTNTAELTILKMINQLS